MEDKGFTHLHVHSEYSLLDGAASIKKLVSQCKKLGMDSLSLTDHGNMFGAVEFYSQAQAAGIKPILGIEASYELSRVGWFNFTPPTFLCPLKRATRRRDQPL